MYGFQPKHARAKAPAQKLADGGLVHSIKGMMGMRPKTREELLAADAKNQARNQEAAARVAARAAQQPAAAAPAPQSAITDYTGMSAMQRREKEQGLADGGMVMKPRGFKAGGMIRGPGTGTSDSIPDKMAPGTFIMPADSTEALGLDDDQGGGEKVPVRVSNGEFELPPERVQAVGTAVLQAIKGMTHTPTSQAGEGEPMARGFKPKGEQQFFAEGGLVENDVTRVGNSYSGGNVGGAVSINGQAGAGTMSTVPTPVAAPVPAAANPTTAATTAATPAAAKVTPAATPAPAPMGWAERNALRGTQVTASSILDSPERKAAQLALGIQAPAAPGQQNQPAAVADTTPPPMNRKLPLTALMGTQPTFGFQPRGYANGGTVQDEERQRLANQTAMYVQGAQAAAASRPPEPVAQPVAPAAPSEYSRQMSAVGGALADGASWLGKTIVSAPGYGFNKPSAAPAVQSAAGGGRGSINPAPVTPSQPAPAMAAPTTATTTDASTQDANESTPGPGPLSFGEVTPQNDAAAQAMSATPTAPAGFQPRGVQAPTVRNSTNDWAARKALENAATAASSITANGSRFDQNGPAGSPQAAAYRAALATDQAMQQAQPGMDQAAMRENAGLQREGLQQDGANTRAGMQEAGAAAREAGRNALAQGELGLKREAAGFQTRAAAQQERLRNVLLDPNASPEQRKIAQRSLAALSGKTAADRMQAVNLPDTTTETGQVVRGGQALVRTLEDGSVEQVPIGGQQKAAPPPTRESLTKGQVVNLPDGRKGRWNGSSFELVG